MATKRNWISYEASTTGYCHARWNGKPWRGTYTIGTYHSGRSRVYEGVFTSIKSGDGRVWTGHDRWCLIEALTRLFEQMSDEGLQLVCAGLDERFYETGLSSGSGYGYLRGLENDGPFLIFDSVP